MQVERNLEVFSLFGSADIVHLELVFPLVYHEFVPTHCREITQLLYSATIEKTLKSFKTIKRCGK